MITASRKNWPNFKFDFSIQKSLNRSFYQNFMNWNDHLAWRPTSRTAATLYNFFIYYVFIIRLEIKEKAKRTFIIFYFWYNITFFMLLYLEKSLKMYTVKRITPLCLISSNQPTINSNLASKILWNNVYCHDIKKTLNNTKKLFFFKNFFRVYYNRASRERS